MSLFHVGGVRAGVVGISGDRFFLLKTNFVFFRKGAKLGIVIFLAVKRIIQWALRILLRHKAVSPPLRKAIIFLFNSA